MTNHYLEWVDKNQQGRRLEIVDRVYIGRTCQGIESKKRIILDDQAVSRDHAVITKSASHLRVADRSKNGTWVNSIRVAPGSSKYLANEDTIHIGETFFKVVFPQTWVENIDDTATDSTVVTPSEVVVTNLVADVRKFSEFSQKHASSEVYAIIKEIFNSFSGIVDEFNGTIKDYAGDAVYAFWDHQADLPARQAVLACQSAIRQVQTLDEILAGLAAKYTDVEDLQMGWGITTGNVTMSHYGSRMADLALVGDCINLAFRLSGIANREISEKILMCSRTTDLVRNELAVEDLGMVSVRGRKGKEHVFALQGHVI